MAAIGYEGQGPKHFFCPLEAFLIHSCWGGDNWIVANLHHACELLHLLSAPVARTLPRKPLNAVTPENRCCAPPTAVPRKAESFNNRFLFHRVLWDDAHRGNSDRHLAADDKDNAVVMWFGQGLLRLLEERDARASTTSTAAFFFWGEKKKNNFSNPVPCTSRVLKRA